MADGFDAAAAYASRSSTFAAGSQVASAVLNAIQDGIIAVSAALDTLASRLIKHRTASGNTSDSPAPDTYGGAVVWVEKATNGTTAVLLDSGIDWRDRFVEVVGGHDGGAGNVAPGGASDNALWMQLHNGATFTDPVHGFGYTEQGGSGAAQPRGPLQNLGTDTVYIYARSSDGALMMVKSGTTDADVTFFLKVTASPTQNHY